ncbi:MAG TPA: NAD(P)-dependent oxidoreductase [Bacilli bacterium]
MKKFKVGLSRDFLNNEGKVALGTEGIDFLLQFDHIDYAFFDQHKSPVEAYQLQPFNAVISLTPHYTKDSLTDTEDLLVIARWGVGYDFIDVQACTDADVALTITPNGVRRPVAYSILTLMLALAHNLLAKSRLISEKRWDDRTLYPGKGITGKTLGSIGLGNIAKEMFRMTDPFDMQKIAFDPYIDPAAAEKLGVELVSMDALCERSDFLAVNCFLSKETFHLISEKQFKQMKPSSFIINTARGGIIDEKALITALNEKWIAGAGLDVFEEEPFVTDSPLHHMENVIITPHSLCWTDELYKGIWKEAAESVVKFSRGEITANVVNKDVLQKPGFLKKLDRLKC